IGSVSDAAIATSAGYFCDLHADGQPLEPLVDPRLRACVRWNGSVSVIAPTAMVADALTKVVGLARGAAPDILEHFAAQAVVVDHQGMRCCGRPLLLLRARGPVFLPRQPTMEEPTRRGER